MVAEFENALKAMKSPNQKMFKSKHNLKGKTQAEYKLFKK